ncbi:MAG: Holliday junction branch migration protein RuvA [Acidiferrobacteraceae bacterium]
MIGYLRGLLAGAAPPHLVVEVHGVGYEVEAPLGLFAQLPAQGEALLLYTHLVVRDDAHLLYGFGRESERRLFRRLLKVTGVGPRLALAVLSGMSEQQFCEAIAAKDAARMAKIPGIGRKTAERMLIELADLKDEFGPAFPPSGPLGDAIAALVALGYKDHEATVAVRDASREGPGTREDLVRHALKRMIR